MYFTGQIITLDSDVVKTQMSRDMRFPTMCYVRPTMVHTSLRKSAVWSDPLLVAWIFYEY